MAIDHRDRMPGLETAGDQFKCLGKLETEDLVAPPAQEAERLEGQHETQNGCQQQGVSQGQPEPERSRRRGNRGARRDHAEPWDRPGQARLRAQPPQPLQRQRAGLAVEATLLSQLDEHLLLAKFRPLQLDAAIDGVAAILAAGIEQVESLG